MRGSSVRARWSRDGGPGVLLLGSALNLLLFSPSYGGGTLERISQTIRCDKRRSYVFSVPDTVKKNMIERLEGDADNLLVVRSTRRPFGLFMRIGRLRGVSFVPDEVEVPIAPETLEESRASPITVAGVSFRRCRRCDLAAVRRHRTTATIDATVTVRP